jgi:predicted transcriptional regulator
MQFENIDLKEMSWNILQFLHDKEPMKADAVAEAMGLKTRQVDAAVTKSLVRYGFVIREAKLTRVMKKEYNLLKTTERGKNYVQWKLNNDKKE